jgi:hypothetical protein
MKSKKVKEVATLYLDRIDADCAAGMKKYTYSCVCGIDSNLSMPQEITVKNKRQPNTINEFLKVNELLEEDVLDELIKNYK